MFGVKKQALPVVDGLTLTTSGVEIFQQEKFKPYFLEIKNLVSCPDDIYRELYLPTLYRLAEYCQTMPFAENDFNTNYGLLDRQLKLAITILQLRRGLHFPKNAGAEKISAEEAQWTYALFSGALLKDFHLIHKNREVILHATSKQITGIWLPIGGTLYEATPYYNMNFVTKESILNTDVVMSALSYKILPDVVLKWFSNNTYLMNQWWDVIMHQVAQDNEIEKIIQISASKSDIKLLSQLNPVISKEDYKHDFIKYIEEGVKNNPEQVIKINIGLFVTTSIIDDFLSTKKVGSKDAFMQALEKANWLVPSDNSRHHIITPKKLEDLRELHGVILNIDALSEVLQKLPISTIFQKQVKL